MLLKALVGAPGNPIGIAAATLARRAPTPTPPAAGAGNVTTPGLKDVVATACVTHRLSVHSHFPFW